MKNLGVGGLLSIAKTVLHQPLVRLGLEVTIIKKLFPLLGVHNVFRVSLS